MGHSLIQLSLHHSLVMPMSLPRHTCVIHDVTTPRPAVWTYFYIFVDLALA